MSVTSTLGGFLISLIKTWMAALYFAAVYIGAFV
jgi:hypothetical protein